MSNQPRALRAGAGAGAGAGSEAQAASSAAGARIAAAANLRSSDLRVISGESVFIFRVQIARVLETTQFMIIYLGTVKPFIA